MEMVGVLMRQVPFSRTFEKSNSSFAARHAILSQATVVQSWIAIICLWATLSAYRDNLHVPVGILIILVKT